MQKYFRYKTIVIFFLFLSSCTISQKMGNTSKATLTTFEKPENKYFIFTPTGTTTEISLANLSEIVKDEEHFDQAILRSVKYPALAREKGEQGYNTIEAIVDEKGIVIDIKILKTLTKTLDEESLRVFKMVTENGIKPYMYNGKLTKIKIKKSILYKLE